MLVVVIIIAILAGMILGLLKISGNWVAKSQTNERLGKVRAAIEEFYAEYGEYPPVPIYGGTQPFGYEYPITNGMSTVAAVNMTPDAPIFTFGLMSFLVTRYTGHADGLSAAGVNQQAYQGLFTLPQWTSYNALMGDQPRDINAVNRWKTYLDVATYGNPLSNNFVQGGGQGAYFFTALFTVYDGWGKELNYSSTPPYQSYKLWSNGPDGISGTADDISTGPGY
jgi:type II secretory pathway pseudopilin PulG